MSCRYFPVASTSFQLRVMFEVQDLKFATLATVSRCGMVWFSEDVLSLDMVFENFLSRLRDISIDDAEDSRSRFALTRQKQTDVLSPTMQVLFGSHWPLLAVSTQLFSLVLRCRGTVLICWLRTWPLTDWYHDAYSLRSL